MTYTGEKIKPVGVADIDVKCQKQHKNLILYVVRKARVTLFGRDWLKHIAWRPAAGSIFFKEQGRGVLRG